MEKGDIFAAFYVPDVNLTNCKNASPSLYNGGNKYLNYSIV